MQTRPARVPIFAALCLLAASAFGWSAGSAQDAVEAEPPSATSNGAGVVHSWALAPGDGSQAGDRSNMFYELPPGGEANDAVTLFNYSNVKLVFTIYATDAFNNADGEFDLLAGDETPVDVGRWVTLPQREIAVDAQQQVTFPITIRVPIDATPGDHAGAVLAASTAIGTAPNGKVINLDRRTGSRVYVRVGGTLTPALTVASLKTTYRPALNPLAGRAEVTYRVENRGNVRVAGTHRVSVGAPLGLLRKSAKSEPLPELLPGEGITLTKSFGGVPATVVAVAEVDVDPTPAGGLDDMEAELHRSFAFAIPLSIVAMFLAWTLVRFSHRSYVRRRHDQIVVRHRAP